MIGLPPPGSSPNPKVPKAEDPEPRTPAITTKPACGGSFAHVREFAFLHESCGGILRPGLSDPMSQQTEKAGAVRVDSAAGFGPKTQRNKGSI